jgi:hypothetical protein
MIENAKSEGIPVFNPSWHDMNGEVYRVEITGP